MKTKSIYFLHFFLLYFFGSMLTTQSVNGGRFSERDLDTLLLRSGYSIPDDNEAVASEQVPKAIRDLVSSAPAVSLDTIPKRLQSVIQYALEQPYPGKGIEAPPGSRSNKLKKSTIVYLITSRLRQRGNNNEVQVENETPSQEYGNPDEQAPNGYRTILQEVKSEEKPVARTVLQPKTQYSGRNIQQASKQSYNAPVGRSQAQSEQIRSYDDSPPEPQQSVLTILPRPTPPSPDFEIIRTVSSEAGPILAAAAAAQKHNLRSAYRAAYQYPSEQQVEIQEQAQPSSVRFVHTPPQQTVQQDVDEGLAVLGGPEGLSDIVSKIEGLGESPQPNQLVLAPDTYTANIPVHPALVPVEPAPVPVDVVHQVNNNNLPPPPPPSYDHSSPNEYITYLNPPLEEQGKPISHISPINFDGALKTLPFKRINRFFQNVYKSFRTNLASLRKYRPNISYANDPWTSGSHHNSNHSPAPQGHQNQNQPVLVSTTTYSGPPPPHQHQH